METLRHRSRPFTTGAMNSNVATLGYKMKHVLDIQWIHEIVMEDHHVKVHDRAETVGSISAERSPNILHEKLDMLGVARCSAPQITCCSGQIARVRLPGCASSILFSGFDFSLFRNPKNWLAGKKFFSHILMVNDYFKDLEPSFFSDGIKNWNTTGSSAWSSNRTTFVEK